MDMSGDSYGVDLHFLAIRLVAVVVLLAGAWVRPSLPFNLRGWRDFSEFRARKPDI